MFLSLIQKLWNRNFWFSRCWMRLVGGGFRSRQGQKSFSMQITKNIFAEVRTEEKGNNTLTYCVSQSSSSQIRRGDKKRKRKNWRHHLKHQSYVVAPSNIICVILTSCCWRNIDHRWWSKKRLPTKGGPNL